MRKTSKVNKRELKKEEKKKKEETLRLEAVKEEFGQSVLAYKGNEVWLKYQPKASLLKKRELEIKKKHGFRMVDTGTGVLPMPAYQLTEDWANLEMEMCKLQLEMEKEKYKQMMNERNRRVAQQARIESEQPKRLEILEKNDVKTVRVTEPNTNRRVEVPVDWPAKEKTPNYIG